MKCPPRIEIVPGSVRNAGPQIIAVAAKAGIVLDPVQEAIVRDTSGVRKDGRWSAFETVLFQPRQNGKSEILIARLLAGLLVFGEQLQVYSSHQSRTSAKVFRRLKQAIEGNPQTAGRIARVSNRSGAESIELTTGQVVEFAARSTSSGRGYTGDVVYLDEAQDLDSEQLAAILPMLSTRKNPQIWYALSVGNESSTHLGQLRARALARQDPNVAWLEWSMPEGARIDDPSVWAAANPAYPERITPEYVTREFAALGPEQFARERLGRSSWPQDESGRFAVISREAWVACQDPEERVTGPAGFGVAVSRDGRTAAIVAWGAGIGGLPVADVVDHRPGDGAGWVGPRLAELLRKHETAAVAWDDESLAGPLGLASYTGRVKTVTPKPGELAQACAKFMYSIEDKAARHTGDVRLTAAVGAARIRPSRAAWHWDDRAYAAEVLQAATWAMVARQSGRSYDLLRSVAGPS